MIVANKEEIEIFLCDCKRVLECEPCSFYIPSANRQDNKATLLALGFNKQNVIDEIRNLIVDDYSEGPSPDRVYLGDSWIFGKMINGKEVYIKLQVSRFNDPGDEIRTVYCISFHFACEPLTYPYKEERER